MEIKEKVIVKMVVGSQAYGTSTPQSDIDYKGIYIQSNDDILSFKYNEQIEVGKDECYYEIRRFLQLAQSANPTILEMLFMDEQFIIETSQQFELLRSHKEKFLTKKCCQSFGGYAVAQIRKAKGLDKKMNWEKARVERKTPLDFCYAYEEGKTIPIEKYLKNNQLEQSWCGLVGLDHFKDCYALYYDHSGYYGHKGDRRDVQPLGFKGIVLDDSNSVRTSSVPKYIKPETIIYYNKDGYSMHCKDYKEYIEWLENRNTQRFIDTKHGQKIDGKNLLHCVRLLDMGKEIATDKTIRVLRPNADYLLQIRRGEVELKDIIDKAENDIIGLDEIYNKSDLPTSVDMTFLNDLLLQLRK